MVTLFRWMLLGTFVVGLSSCLPGFESGELEVDSSSSGDSSEAEDGAAGNGLGIALYNQHCASCHGAFERSNVSDNTLSDIQRALETIEPMKFLSSLEQDQLQAIADALGGVGDNGSPGGTDAPVPDGQFIGKTLYERHCASCHGSLETSDKTGRTFSQIKLAIGAVSRMSHLSSLSDEDLQNIAYALDPDSNPSSANFGRFSCEDENFVGARNSKKLSLDALKNTFTDLLSRALTAGETQSIVDNAFLSTVLPDSTTRYTSFDNNVGVFHARGYFQLADDIAKGVAENQTLRNKLLQTYIGYGAGSCSLNLSSPSNECMSQFVRNFGLRVLRRPLSEVSGNNEVDRFVASYSSSDVSGSLSAILFQMFLAPHFLFHIENHGIETGRREVFQLSDFEIASRLSYFYWNSMPDEYLFQLATGGLATDERFNLAVNYVLDQNISRSDRVAGEYLVEWLKVKTMPNILSGTNRLNHLHPSVTINDSLKEAMTEEIKDLGRFGIRNGFSLEQLFTTNASVTSHPDLMRIYRISSPGSVDMSPASIPRFPAHERGGILTRSAMLVSKLDTEDPFHRGLKIRTEIFCKEVPSPDNVVDADELLPPPISLTDTTRERYEKKTSRGTCLACHSQFNGLGFALSNFDVLGGYQNAEPIFAADGSYANIDLPVDSSVDLSTEVASGVTSENHQQFSQILSQRHEVKKCMTQQFFQFAEGRNENLEQDGCRLERLRGALDGSNTLRDFFRSYVTDPQFRLRKIEE